MLIRPTTMSDQFEVPDDAVALYVTVAAQPLTVRPFTEDDTAFHAADHDLDVCRNCRRPRSEHFSSPGLTGTCPRLPRFVFHCQGCNYTCAPQAAGVIAMDADEHAASCRRLPLPCDRRRIGAWPNSREKVGART